MKKRRKLSLILVGIVGIVILGATIIRMNRDTHYIVDIDEQKVLNAYQLLNNALNRNTLNYHDYLDQNDFNYGQNSVKAEPLKGIEDNSYEDLVVTLDYGQKVEYEIEVDHGGLYHLKLDYKPMVQTLTDYFVSININGVQQYEEMKSIALPLFWSDETKEYPKDRYQDEIAPYQVIKEEWSSLYLYNSTYNTADPLLFYFEEGTNLISISNISGKGLGLGNITVENPKNQTPSYKEYEKQYQGELVTEYIPINSIQYIEKNTTQAIVSSENNPVLTPHDSEYKLLNIISWKDAGDEITYQMDVLQDGFHNIALHYKNNKEEFNVFQTIRIDGVVLFKELQSYEFPSTGGDWKNHVLSDGEGNPYQVYLTQGRHTISIRAEQEPIVKAYQYARTIAQHTTRLELEITKIAGSTKDSDRTWQMTRYIPEIPEYLEAYETLIEYIKYLVQYHTPNGTKSAILSDLNKAMQFVDQMAEYPDEIALYKANLTTARDNSILKSLSNFSTEITTQDFSLNMIYVYGNQELPKENAGVFVNVWNDIKNLVYSYTSPKFKIKEEPDAVNIWVNRATTHVDLLQKMADTQFTPEHNIKVNISIMPDQNKLVLGAASGKTPDIALGISSHIPFELASRGALYDLTKFEDYWEIADRFVPGASVSYIYNEGIYALPETLEFSALIYRTDIFEQIGLNPPDTWQDVTEMLPTLQRYGMNFFHNISSGVGYKWYWQTAPLILQNKGSLFTEDGLRTALDQTSAVKGVQALGDLFITYSLPKEVVSFFNSFRYGTLPVGIIGLNDYILIKNGAAELEGRWALSSYPGTEQEDGSIDRWYIANGSAGIIFEDSERAQDAWEFMKWWTDFETQMEYSHTLQSTYGKTFVWLPSNVDAMMASPIEEVDKRVIVEQVKWMRDVVRTPGQYILERSISDIWNAMVNDGVSAQVAIDEKVIGINREIRKKMMELGYYDAEGNLIKSYILHDVDWIIEQIELAKEEVKE